MQAAIQAMVPDSTLIRLLTYIGFVAAFGMLLGFWGVNEVIGGTGNEGYLRKVGLLLLTIALAVRTVSLAMSFLTSVTLSYSPAEGIASGESIASAITFTVIGGAVGLFATVLALVGVAFWAVSLMNADLIGADKPLAIWLGVAPAIVGSFLLFVATFIEGSIFTLYLLGNLTVFVQVAWVVLVGVAFIRKSDSLVTAA
ncbi:MAG: hypothetical protein F4176_10670 [Acidimicrobiia bacterium]|nr:hypothetical protein [Acidimicrobiia bacterium]